MSVTQHMDEECSGYNRAQDRAYLEKLAGMLEKDAERALATADNPALGEVPEGEVAIALGAVEAKQFAEHLQAIAARL